MTIHTIKLEDFEVLYVDGLDGGGFDHLPDFIDAVGYLDTIQKLAEDAGLIFIDKHPAPMLSKDSKSEAVIFHFKEPL